MVESGLCGMFLPREFGGSGASLTALTAAAEAVAAGCATTAAIISTYQLGAFPSCSKERRSRRQNIWASSPVVIRSASR